MARVLIPAVALAWLLAEPVAVPQVGAAAGLPVLIPAVVLAAVEEQAGLLVWASVLFQAEVADVPPDEAAVLLRALEPGCTQGADSHKSVPCFPFSVRLWACSGLLDAGSGLAVRWVDTRSLPWVWGAHFLVWLVHHDSL